MGKTVIRAAMCLTMVIVSALPASANVAGFSDVRGSEFYAVAVAWMRGAGLTTGVGGTGQYQADGPITRAQMATFLWRLAGEPAANPPHLFADVPNGVYYTEAVAWMRAAGLTTGVGGSNRFEPDTQLTRGQMAAFLWRYHGEPSGHPPHGFSDVSGGVYYGEAVAWMKATGITTGVGGSNRFEPDTRLTRGQMAAFIWRYVGQPAPPNPGDTKNCSDFATQSAAQAWFNMYFPYFGDIAKLDQDNNMIPCEALP